MLESSVHGRIIFIIFIMSSVRLPGRLVLHLFHRFSAAAAVCVSTCSSETTNGSKVSQMKKHHRPDYLTASFCRTLQTCALFVLLRHLVNTGHACRILRGRRKRPNSSCWLVQQEGHESSSHSSDKLFNNVGLATVAPAKRICIVHFVAARVVSARLVAVAKGHD